MLWMVYGFLEDPYIGSVVVVLMLALVMLMRLATSLAPIRYVSNHAIVPKRMFA